MSHLAPGVVLFEKRPRWESELKRGLAEDRVLIRPCRSPTDLTALCRAMGGSVAVIDFEMSPAIVLEWLQDTHSRGLAVSPVIILPRDAGALEWPLRELGVLGVLITPVRTSELIQLCRSLLDARSPRFPRRSEPDF